MILSTLFLLASIASASAPKEFTSSCKAGDKSFVLRGVSPSGDPGNNDDMTLSIEQEGKSVPVKADVGFYRFVPPAEKSTRSICDGIAAYRTHQDRVLLLIGQDQRPSPAQAMGILYDPVHRRVRRIAPKLGTIPGDPEELTARHKDGKLRLRLIKEWNPDTQAPVFKWREFEVKGDRIKVGDWR